MDVFKGCGPRFFEEQPYCLDPSLLACPPQPQGYTDLISPTNVDAFGCDVDSPGLAGYHVSLFRGGLCYAPSSNRTQYFKDDFAGTDGSHGFAPSISSPALGPSSWLQNTFSDDVATDSKRSNDDLPPAIMEPDSELACQSLRLHDVLDSELEEASAQAFAKLDDLPIIIARRAKQTIDRWCATNLDCTSPRVPRGARASRQESMRMITKRTKFGESVLRSVRASFRGKRRTYSRNDVPVSKPSNNNLIGPQTLSCTVCASHRASVYDWKRHEGQHYQPWTCMPEGSHIIDGHCALCLVEDISAEHTSTHQNVHNCAEHTQETSFRGKDKLIEHIRDQHLDHTVAHELSTMFNKKHKQLLDAWECPTSSALWCGFCESYLLTWSQRLDHVLNHLRQSMSSADWEHEP